MKAKKLIKRVRSVPKLKTVTSAPKLKTAKRHPRKVQLGKNKID